MNRPSAAQASQKAENRVIGIDYMRLFAALAVMLYHYGYYFGLTAGEFGGKVPPSHSFTSPGPAGLASRSFSSSPAM
jgi:peptidoglycan/LPS O-acetylase OafA/YrhL